MATSPASITYVADASEHAASDIGPDRAPCSLINAHCSSRAAITTAAAWLERSASVVHSPMCAFASHVQRCIERWKNMAMAETMSHRELSNRMTVEIEMEETIGVGMRKGMNEMRLVDFLH